MLGGKNKQPQPNLIALDDNYSYGRRRCLDGTRFVSHGGTGLFMVEMMQA